jgi:hypothetical protein
MSQKKDRLIKRQVSREARGKLGYEFELLKDIFRPRPKFIPKFLWELGLSIYVRKGEFDYKPWGDKK